MKNFKYAIILKNFQFVKKFVFQVSLLSPKCRCLNKNVTIKKDRSISMCLKWSKLVKLYRMARSWKPHIWYNQTYLWKFRQTKRNICEIGLCSKYKDFYQTNKSFVYFRNGRIKNTASMKRWKTSNHIIKFNPKAFTSVESFSPMLLAVMLNMAAKKLNASAMTHKRDVGTQLESSNVSKARNRSRSTFILHGQHTKESIMKHKTMDCWIYLA